MIDPDTIWPFRPNWRSEVVEEYEFNTDVFQSRAQREQRRALREEPRKKWEFASLVHGASFRESMALVSSRFDSSFYLANPIYRAILAAPVAIGESILTVTDPPGWIAADTVLHVSSGETRRAYLVTAVDVDEITVDGVSDVVWPAGSTVRLAETVYTDDLKTDAETASVVTLRNVLAVDPSLVGYSGVSVAGPTFNSRELFLKTPNWREGLGVDLASGREAVDFGFGLTAYYSPVPFVLRDYRAVYVGRDLADAEAVVNFFRRMKGRRDEFYMPTDTSDIVPSLALSGSTLRTAGLAYYRAFNSGLVDSSTVLKALIVFLNDGTYLPRLITSVTFSGDETIFNLATSWSGTIALGNIRKVSFLPVCRFAADKLAVEWQTNAVAQFTLPVKALEAL